MFSKEFWTAREYGQGYFGGAEGALRFLVLFFAALIVAAIIFLLKQ